VKLLLEAGADPTIKNTAGHDPVFEAEVADKKDVVEWVLKEGGSGLEKGLGQGGESEAEMDGAFNEAEAGVEDADVERDLEMNEVKEGKEGLP